MKYTFKDVYNNFEDIKVGECFSIVNSSRFPQTTVFMKLPTVIEDNFDKELCNSICLCGSTLHYICNEEKVIIRDVELIIKKR